MKSNIIDIAGFKIHIDTLVQKRSLPDCFNSPLICSWEITRACNLKCIHCYNNSHKRLSSELSHLEKLSVAKQLGELKIFRVCISGGEPLLSKSFWEIIKILNQYKVCCNMITNGYLINEKIAEKIGKYFHLVQVSLDGSTPEVHDKIRGKKGSWKRAIKACQYLSNNDVKFSICFTPLKYNINQIGNMIDLAYEIGAHSFRTEKTKLTGRAVKNIHIIPNDEDYHQYEETIHKKRKEYKEKMPIEHINDVPLAFSITSQNIPNFYCHITPSGVVSPNPTLPFSGGSLKEKSLEEIWNELKLCHKNQSYINLLNKVKGNKDYLKLSEIPYFKRELYD